MVSKVDHTSNTRKKGVPEAGNDERNTGGNAAGTHTLKKKPRSLGSFPCPDCDKVFTRSDHLSRHHLNHAPKEVFECDFLMEEIDRTKRRCGRTFVRKDLMERHYKRHSEVYSGMTKRRRTREVQTAPNFPQDPPKQNSQQRSVKVLQLPQQLQQQHLPPSQAQADGLATSDPTQLQHAQRSMPLEPFSYSPNVPINNVFNQNAGANQNPIVLNQDYSMFNPGLPPSQNDILSWLFTDSPPNPTNQQQRSLEQQKLVTPSESSLIPISQQNQTQQYPAEQPLLQQMLNLDPAQTPSGLILSTLPPPLLASNLSTPASINSVDHKNNQFHIQNQFQNQQQQQFQQQQQQQLQLQLQQQLQQLQEQQPISSTEDPSLTPFYNPNPSHFNNVNIFSNDNPLDELFLKNFPESGGMYGNNVNPLFGLNLVTPNSNFNFMTSTASSSSPATTSESLTPRASNGSVISIEHENTIYEAIMDHSRKGNSVKNKLKYVDGLIVDRCLSAVKLDRKELELIFDDEHANQNSRHNNVITIEDRFSYYLSLYWDIFHTQFSILHRPSFDTQSCSPLLLLSMAIVGCNYTEYQPVNKTRSAEFKFSNLIARPLRFMIFQDEDFRTPIKLWILQSLNILEWCEKNFLTRDMHERAHIHHGTTAQLLRRSPLLGGNPANRPKEKRKNGAGSATTSAGEEESDSQPEGVIPRADDTDYDLFMKWVESELMKRITFMTFYSDTVDYIKFRHNPQIMFYQLQLLCLPCDDVNLWESTEVLGSFKRVVKRQKKLQQQQQQQHHHQHQPNGHSTKYAGIKFGESFLSALKKLIKPHSSDFQMVPKTGLSLFTKKVLFAGLLLIMYQMQQADIQNTSSLLSLTSKNGGHSNGYLSSSNLMWKESLTKAFDNWNIEINESCTRDERKYQNQQQQPLNRSHLQTQLQLLFSYQLASTICHFPMYHLTQIIGMSDLNQYDIAIFGGSPANMSVDATMKDHVMVQAKLNNMWSKYSQQIGKKKNVTEMINLKSVIHSYLLLWELMLKPPQSVLSEDGGTLTRSENYLDWNATPDYFDSMYAVGVATLTLWSFCMTTSGLESNKFDDKLVDNENYHELVAHSKESGHDYLYRIRQEFTENITDGDFVELYGIHPFKLAKGNGSLSAHELLCKYAELLPRITNKQNISGLCFLVGTKLMCSQWEILRENARLILNCGLRSIGKKTILCQNLFLIEWD